MADTPTCPSTAELQQFAQGELSESRAQAIEEHLKSCRRCAESLERRTSGGATIAEQHSQRESTSIENVADRLTGTRSNDPTVAYDHNLKESDVDTTADLAAVNQTGIVES